MYEVVDTQDHMEQVLTNDKCGCGGMEEMEVGGNTVVGDDTEVTKTCATNVQQGGTLGDFDHMRENVRYSGGQLSPFNKPGTYQFFVTILVVIMCGIVSGFGVAYIIRLPDGKSFLTMGTLQTLLGIALTIVYSFDSNDSEDDCKMYNTLKLITVCILCVMIFFKTENKQLSLFIMLVALIINILMMFSMLNIVKMKGMQPNNTKQYITRFLSAVLYLTLWISKMICIYKKDTSCISDLDLLDPIEIARNMVKEKDGPLLKMAKGGSMNGGDRKSVV